MTEHPARIQLVGAGKPPGTLHHFAENTMGR